MSVVHNLANYMGLCPANIEVNKAVNSTVDQQAIIIADYIHRSQVLGKQEPPPDRISGTVGWIVEEFLNGNSETFSSITEILDDVQVDAKGKTDEQVIANVLNAMFADGKCNWGRVASTYAFGVKYCQMYLYDENGNQYNSSSEKVMHFIGEYVGQHLGAWIRSQGGWEIVLSLYPNQKLILKQLRSAGVLVLAVGVGSLLNVLSS